ncbi:MAG: hypothetical protein ACLP3C_29940 [Mycobacterium sp.]|uniref:hypothetical protein n=1 Tax=Mycobacterium sp. TaxID=1785 RepID=UPI003F991CEE
MVLSLPMGTDSLQVAFCHGEPGSMNSEPAPLNRDGGLPVEGNARVVTGSRLTLDRLQGEMRRKDGLDRLVTLVEKMTAGGSKPRVVLRIAVPT